MDFIIDKVTAYLNKAICKYAKEKGITNSNDVQVLFYLRQDGLASVKMCQKYKPVEETTFKKAMGLKIDLLNLAGATEYFVQQSLVDFCASENIQSNNISVMVVRKSDDDILMFLYNGIEFVKKIEPENIFDQSKIKME